MFDIITIGDCTVDTFIVIDPEQGKLECDLNKDNCELCLNYATKIPIKQAHQSIGGNAANVAAGCKKLGLETALVSELGDDLNGFTIKHEIESKGIDTKLIKILKNNETRYSVVLNYLAERTVLSSQVKRNYTLPKLPATNWIYYTSLLTPFAKLQDDLIKYLKKNPQTKLAVNPGSHQIKEDLKKFKEILPYIEIIFLNKEEGKTITKESEINKIMKALHRLGCKKVVLTDGTKGAYFSDNTQSLQMLPYPIKPVDKTGAGDAFASGFLSAIFKDKTPSEAMQWGTANAGGVIQKIGAEEGLMSEKEIARVIKKYSSIRPKIY